MKTVIITGVGGMIGNAVAELLLQKNFRVIGTDTTPQKIKNENYTHVQCSISEKEKLSKIISGSKPFSLIHLACTVDNDFPDILTPDHERESAAADRYIYKAAEAAGAESIMMISTYQIYAPQKTREPIREDAPEKPVTLYSKMKYESERALVAALKKNTRSKGVIMRVCPVYTKDFHENLKAKIFDPRENCAFVYGYGDYGYTFTCVFNIVDFVYGILTCDSSINVQGIYNICDTKPITAKEIVEMLRSCHKIGAVVSRNYGADAVKSSGLFGPKTWKNEYRYNDLSIACSNISYDNTKAQRISTFRWKLSNTK